MTLREGNLEAPTRHPIDWQGADYHDEAQGLRGDGAGLRHLPRLPALREPVPGVPDAVRPGRRERRRRGARRRQEGLRQGRRPVLPVRPLLHDEVPVRAAAPVERRLPAPDAARQGDQVTARARSAPARGCSPRPTCTASSPASRSSCRRSTRRTGRGRCARCSTPRSASIPMPGCRRSRRSAFAAARRRARSASRVRDGERTPGQGRDLLDLLRQLQRARHRPRPARACSSTTTIPYEIVEKESCCGMPKLELGDLEGVASAEGEEHPGARALRARGLRDPDARCRRAR